jgi:hypothetical protein
MKRIDSDSLCSNYNEFKERNKKRNENGIVSPPSRIFKSFLIMTILIRYNGNYTPSYNGRSKFQYHRTRAICNFDYVTGMRLATC